MTHHIRVMNDADIPAAMRLKDSAGWNQTISDWRFFLESSPQGCFAAEIEGELIGTSATATYESKLAWIGMIIVDERFRGQGIGKALLQRAIEYLDSRHIPCMKL